MRRWVLRARCCGTVRPLSSSSDQPSQPPPPPPPPGGGENNKKTPSNDTTTEQQQQQHQQQKESTDSSSGAGTVYVQSKSRISSIIDQLENQNNGKSGDGPKIFGRKVSQAQLDNLRNSPILAKLNTFDAEMDKRKGSRLEAARSAKAIVLKKRREHMLTFRDVGHEFDGFNLFRDPFTFLKIVWRGKEYHVDSQLEQMLKYHKENVYMELQFHPSGKILKGPKQLLKVKSPGSIVGSGGGGSAASSLSEAAKKLKEHNAGTQQCPVPLFPRIELFKLSEFMADPRLPEGSKELEERKKALVGLHKKYLTSEIPRTTSSSASIRKPTFVVLSHFLLKTNAVAERAWCNIAYNYIDPTMITREALVEGGEDGRNSESTGVSEQLTAAPRKARMGAGVKEALTLARQAAAVVEKATSSAGGNGSTVTTLHKKKKRQINVMVIRSFHMHTFRPMQRYLLKDFLGHETNVTPILYEDGYVGEKVHDAFFEPLGLRNYMCPYAMLVDHKGQIRWLSSGVPDAEEAELLPKLLHQLENEYLRAIAGGKPVKSPHIE